MKYVIEAENIKCEGCASTIRDALDKIPGVQNVSVDISNGRVTVSAGEGLKEAIIEALHSSGYPKRKAG